MLVTGFSHPLRVIVSIRRQNDRICELFLLLEKKGSHLKIFVGKKLHFFHIHICLCERKSDFEWVNEWKWILLGTKTLSYNTPTTTNERFLSIIFFYTFKICKKWFFIVIWEYFFHKLVNLWPRLADLLYFIEGHLHII